MNGRIQEWKTNLMTIILTLAGQSQEWGVCANVNTPNSGVGIVPTIDKKAEEDKIEIPQELDSNFGEAPY